MGLGAHLLIQVRAKVTNQELPGLFKKWYPKFNAEDHLIDHLQEAA